MKASHWFGKTKFGTARFGKAIGSYLTPRAVLFCFAVLSFSFGALAVVSAQLAACLLTRTNRMASALAATGPS